MSIVVPARNEAGNIEDIVKRLPDMGPDDELIFIEGNSTDTTWTAIQEVQQRYGSERSILIAQQDGKGKGDAVRKGFSIATKDVLMILDADMTVPPEDLPKFYNAIKDGKASSLTALAWSIPWKRKRCASSTFWVTSFSHWLSPSFSARGTKIRYAEPR